MALDDHSKYQSRHEVEGIGNDRITDRHPLLNRRLMLPADLTDLVLSQQPKSKEEGTKG